MSIPKGLIIYQAPRHQNNFPTDVKYGYYSDKMHPYISPGKSNHCKNFGRKYQQKLIQKANLIFVGKGQRDLETLSVFSRFCGIKKCSLFVYDKSPKKDLVVRVFQRLSKVLKRLKCVEFKQCDTRDQQNSKTFKPLILLAGLESFTLPWFIYSQDPKNLEPLMQILKLASKRRSWPKFKSLNLGPLYPQGLTLDRENCPPSLESLKNLLEFTKGLGSCGNLQKYLNIQLALPYISSELGDNQSVATLDEIFRQMFCSLASIQIAEFTYCSKILETLQHSINLKIVTFEITEEVKEKVNLSVLNRIPSFQELNIRVRNNKGIDLLSYTDILTQVKIMSNLTAFSFDITGKQRPIEEFNLNLAGAISSLINLKSLKLNFGRYSKEGGDDKDFEALRSVWFQDVFKAIGERTKLKTLKLTLTHFQFENPKRLFAVFCESLKKLEQLSDLSLDFNDRKRTIEEREIVEFCQCLRNLKQLQEICFSIVCSKFQLEALSEFFSCFASHFPLLSTLNLSLEGVKVSSQAYQSLEKIVQKHGCLNAMNIVLIGQLEDGLDLRLLKNKMLKRFPGNTCFVPRYG